MSKGGLEWRQSLVRIQGIHPAPAPPAHPTLRRGAWGTAQSGTRVFGSRVRLAHMACDVLHSICSSLPALGLQSPRDDAFSSHPWTLDRLARSGALAHHRIDGLGTPIAGGSLMVLPRSLICTVQRASPERAIVGPPRISFASSRYRYRTHWGNGSWDAATKQRRLKAREKRGRRKH